ncbi:MAG: transcriptional regulator, partial [Acidobacteria bacterium]|nr:transcriptional regulator [Acidobacteriota bacterium]
MYLLDFLPRHFDRADGPFFSHLPAIRSYNAEHHDFIEKRRVEYFRISDFFVNFAPDIDIEAGAAFEFGRFRLDPNERLLTRDGKAVRLQGKAFDTLLVLVRNSGHLVTKRDLIGAVWADAFVEENNLAKHVSALRHALNGDGNEFIATVPRQGYRFTAPVN